MSTNAFRNLLVWNKAMELVTQIYTTTKSFPKEELYGLVSQMRRCAVSIPSNIAEGKMRGSEPEFQRFLGIAFGSAGELETQIELGKRLKYLDGRQCKTLEQLLQEVMSIINTLKH
jgi:four helix bundle protein